MRREKCVAYMQKQIEHFINIKQVVETIPTKTVIVFDVEGHYYTKQGYSRKMVQVAGVIKTWNLTSITTRLIAVQDRGLYPFSMKHRELPETYAVKFTFLKGWKVLPKEDLPLLLGWEVRTPNLAKVIKGIDIED